MERQTKILVYRYSPLKISESFVYNQTVKLSRYQAYFLGTKPQSEAKIYLPEDRVKFINNGGLRGKFLDYLFINFQYIPIRIRRWVRSIRPKLLHVYSGYDATLIMSLVKILHIPLVVSFLGSDATIKDKFYEEKFGFRGYLYLLRRKQLIELVSMVIVPSEFLKRKVIEQGFPINKIRIIHHGIDLDQFVTKNKKTEFGHILFVGRLIPVKGLDYLIRSISLLKNQFPEIYLTVIGDGPMREEYEKLARKELWNNFRFLGFKPSNLVKEYLQRAYLFSMPSITMPTGQAESFGVVFLEAQAMGVPVVSFSTGGIPEVVAHGMTGLLSDDCTVEALARNLEELLSNFELRDKMSKLAMSRVRKKFNLKEQNKKLEAIYDLL